MNPAVAGAALVFAMGLAAIASGIVPRERAIATFLLVSAIALALLRQLALAIPLAMVGFSLWTRGGTVGRSAGRNRQPSSGQTSEVSSPALSMRLDHDTGELDGRILSGRRTGQLLSTLDASELREFADDLRNVQDEESLALLLAYMDRLGIDDAQDEAGDSAVQDPGEMSEAEALRILGLAPGASPEEIRAAYRRLMKRVHPDMGGSDALAAMINGAKARLDPD